MFYGMAIGDASGSINESRIDVILTILDFPTIPERKGIKIGDWTDDTDHMILLMETLTEHNNNFDAETFAKCHN